MRTCCVCGMSAEFGKLANNVSFHRFPRNQTVKQKWIDAIGKEDFQPSNYSAVCGLHFTEDCFYNAELGVLHSRRLVANAVPSNFGFRVSHSKKNHLASEGCSPAVNQVSCLITVPLHHVAQDQTINQNNIPDVVPNVDDNTNLPYNLNNQDATCENSPVETKIPSDEDGDASPASPLLVIVKSDFNDVGGDDDDHQMAQTDASSRTVSHPRKYRRYNPRYVGDCEEEHLNCPLTAKRNWKLAIARINGLEKKVAALRQSNRRKQTKIDQLEKQLANFKHQKSST